MSIPHFPYVVVQIRGGVADVVDQKEATLIVVDYDNHPNGEVSIYPTGGASDLPRERLLEMFELEDPKPIEEEADEHEA